MAVKKSGGAWKPSLTIAQTAALFDEVRAYANSERNGKCTQPQFLEELEKRVGAPVSKTMLHRAMKDVPLARFNLIGGRTNNPMTQLYQRVQLLEDSFAKQLSQLETRLSSTEQQLRELLK